MSMFKQHKYCEQCGKKLEEYFSFSHHDMSTGDRLYEMYRACPQRKWYNFFLHDKYLVTGGSFGTSPSFWTNKEINRYKPNVS